MKYIKWLVLLILLGGFFIIFQTIEKGSEPEIDLKVKNKGRKVEKKMTLEEQKEQQINKIISEMSLEEKIGQLFLARVPEINQLEAIKEFHLGGYLLFGRDVEGQTTEQLQTTLRDYQSASKIPLIIASDEEGGTVSRLSRNSELVSSPFLSPKQMYQQNGFTGITTSIEEKSQVMKNLGITAGLYPVADVATNDKAFIYDRTLGVKAETTADYVKLVVEILNKEKMLSTLKHFPGYGNNEDSHLDLVTDERALNELEQIDLLPFEAGIKAGADSIMISHNIVSALDPSLPASLSPKVTNYLRNTLGFNGIIMTDDMDMLGLSKFTTQEEAGLLALKAGNDWILSSSYAKQIPVITEAVHNGDYQESDLNQSVFRTLKVKEKLGLLVLNTN
ncbi:glycoside hydrolase family 3 N-terminal domain-containing protein [Vagococcus sp.]|uniref:glycoside hydrolase family 3 N-terminal domain-containing protein n=1 Tax=Vagococcus sp. TaxID=1933889 RepID=UPI003F9560C8